jgi:redox-sensitive bicupin YhaK (pirin superfamily)
MAITVIRPEDRVLASIDPTTTSAPKSVTEGGKKQVLSQDDPYSHIAQAKANSTIPLHSHSTSEIMVVLSGTVNVAGTRCGASTVLVIPADEKYSLEVEDEDLTFLVVRPTRATYQASA